MTVAILLSYQFRDAELATKVCSEQIIIDNEYELIMNQEMVLVIDGFEPLKLKLNNVNAPFIKVSMLFSNLINFNVVTFTGSC